MKDEELSAALEDPSDEEQRIGPALRLLLQPDPELHVRMTRRLQQSITDRETLGFVAGLFGVPLAIGRLLLGEPGRTRDNEGQ
jgi:hypothetical protein